MRTLLRLIETVGFLVALAIFAPSARAQDRRPPESVASDVQSPPPSHDERPAAPWHERRIVFQATGLYVFALKLNANVDPNGDDPNSVLASASVRTGDGWGFRVAGGWESSNELFTLRGTIGILYLQTAHFETTRRTNMRAGSGYLEPMIEGVFGGRVVGFTAGVGVGAGVSYFHFAHGFDDEASGGFEARLALALTFFEQIDLGLTLGYFIWGYPGRTLGDGEFGALTLTARF